MIPRIGVAVVIATLVATQSGFANASSTVSNLTMHRPANPGALLPVNNDPKVGFFGSNLDWPEGITAGPDGNVWATEFWVGEVTRITPSGGITEFPVASTAQSIVTGPDGNLWFTESGADAIGRITPAGVASSFPIGGIDPRGIAVGPDGNLWFTEMDDGYIGRITTSGVVTRFDVSPNGELWGIITGPDGDIWFTDFFKNLIGRFDPKSLKQLSPIMLNAGDNPWALAIGPDHNVWFTGRSSGKIGTVANGKVSEFTIPGPPTPYPDSITTGPDGNLWFTESLSSGIGRFDPTTKRFTARLALPSTDIPTSITAGPGGNLWFTNPSYNSPDDRIGVVQLH